MKTQELPLFGIQSQAVAVVTEDNVVTCLLGNGKNLVITCPDDRNAREIHNTILYYPVTTNSNNAREFKFEFEINVH